MNHSRKRFFDSTRGRVIKLLCDSTSTVTELAEQLNLTDNAVRAHLASLERDGLVHQTGIRRGTRKPNFAYDLTPAGHQIFPKAHAPVLAAIVDVLSESMDGSQVEQILREAGARLAARHLPGITTLPPPQRVQQLLDTLNKAGAQVEVEQTPDHTAVNGCSCPLSPLVLGHPELCRIAASILTNLLGLDVSEHCQRIDSPRCSFHIQPVKS